SNMELDLLDDITLKYKLANGMPGIYEAMAEDLNCNIRLNTAVTAIAHDTAGATLTLVSGEVVKADATIVTVPVGAMGNVEFSPDLPDSMQNVIDEGWNATGAKIWIKIKGHHKFLGYAPYPAKMSDRKSTRLNSSHVSISYA